LEGTLPKVVLHPLFVQGYVLKKGTLALVGILFFKMDPCLTLPCPLFPPPPLMLGIMRENKKEKELALLNPFFLFFLNHKLSFFNVVHHQTPLMFVIFSAKFQTMQRNFKRKWLNFARY
jgi:hypothetical protein